MKATLRSSNLRPRELLRDAEKRAAGIRKLLKQLGQGQGRGHRGVMDDAAKLASTIELLARWGQTSSAEDAVEVGFLVEVLLTFLEVDIDQIIAS